jgi:hypothetical protein
MKEIAELNFPEDVRYSESHEWVKAAGDTVRIGITDYAQDQLGELNCLMSANPLKKALSSAPWNLLRQFQNYTYLSAEKLLPSTRLLRTPLS